MNNKVPLNKSRILVLVAVTNLLVMVVLIIAAARLNIEIKTNTFSMLAMAGTFLDIALTYLFRTINQNALYFVIINALLSGSLGFAAVALSRSRKPVQGVNKLNFSAENR